MSSESTQERQPSSCPSAFALERYRLAKAQGLTHSLEAHVEGCARCEQYLQEAQEQESAFVVRADLRARVLALADDAPESSKAPPEPWWRAVWEWLTHNPVGAFGGAVAVALALLLFFVGLPSDPDPSRTPDVLRSKGSLKLTIYSDADPRGLALVPGAVVHPDERIRFGVSLPRAAHVGVLSIDAIGEVFVYYPLQGGDRLVHHPASKPGEPTVLKGAIALDEVLGTEWYIGLACQEAVGTGELTAALKRVAFGRERWKRDGVPPLMPGGCVQEAVFLEKTEVP